jgi:hypothetical protein
MLPKARYSDFVKTHPRILVLTPWVPYPVTGACQQDRFQGLRQMKAMGYELQVIAKIHAFQPRQEVEAAFAKEGIPLTLIPHPEHPWKLLLQRIPRILASPSLIDGAALEYTDPPYEAAVAKALEDFKPDLAWIEYTPLWPILRFVKAHGVPCIVKSSLNEPANCRDENGWSLTSILKSLPKYGGEKIAARESDFIFGITPVEEAWYRGWGAVHAGTLPLRGLSRCFAHKTHLPKDTLDVVFLSSNYNMGHNRDALEFLLTKVVPLVRAKAPGVFRFHLTGKKFPKKYERYLADDVRTTGFVEDLGSLLATMDIALCPWISGHGMQQKVFEPLCRGLPLITHKTAGYPFEDGKEILLAQDAEEYVRQLLMLRDASLRQRIADAARLKAQTLFSEETVMHLTAHAIEETLARGRIS